MCFPVKFAKFLRTLFFTEHLQWLLLTLTIRHDLTRIFLVQVPATNLLVEGNISM